MTHPTATGARLEILTALLKQELSSQDLARHLEVSPAAIRQHLATLEALGLVTRRKLVTRPSRPTYLYRASADGMRIFPKRYDLLLNSVVDALLEREGAEAVQEVVRQAAHRTADRARQPSARSRGATPWDAVLQWLDREFSWQAEVEVEPSGARRITIHQCPFQDLSRAPVDVCGVFFTTLLGDLGGDARVEHREASRSPACCAFVVSANSG
jgi:predicted ArsR family transcriptional regulator